MDIYLNSTEKHIVERLICQYNEYSNALQGLDHVRQEIIGAKARGDTPEIDTIKLRLSYLSNYTDRLSQEMSFAWPRVWILYKHLAYKDTPKEIATVGDLREHCSPDGYICTKRYAFLSNQIHDDSPCIADKSIAADEMPILDFLALAIANKQLNDPKLILEWQRHEYLISGDKIAKWQS